MQRSGMFTLGNIVAWRGTGTYSASYATSRSKYRQFKYQGYAVAPKCQAPSLATLGHCSRVTSALSSTLLAECDDPQTRSSAIDRNVTPD